MLTENDLTPVHPSQAQPLAIRFDASQEHQLAAISSVLRLFDGYGRSPAPFRLGEDVVANLTPREVLSEDWLRDNLHAVQASNGVSFSPVAPLDTDEGMVLEGAGNETWRYPSFTIEMETGTGKTYVYLRTIHELRRQYGFGKFVVVVPSVAIYEGVVKNFEITKSHFASLYGNERVNLIKYDGAQLSRLRAFATSTFADILLITLDAFNKINNNIYKPSEKLAGERLPFQYVQETRPIVILDEPQNMESPRAKEALRTLHPLFALRYSATHRSSPNLVYQLTPFDAFQRGLVKRIQVIGVSETDDTNLPLVSLRAVSRRPLRATVSTRIEKGGQTKEVEVVIKHGDDLQAKTKRAEHRGYEVSEINAAEQYLEFANGERLYLADDTGTASPEVFRTQIEQTVMQHMENQERLAHKGIKVISLFFIDRVANYVAADGVIRTLFGEAFEKFRKQYDRFRHLEAEQVQAGYFATVKSGDGADTAIDIEDEESARSKAHKDAAKIAYDLIMRRKERLLSFAEPVAFIFTHSALREGWDNPNIFQICTLKQTMSEFRKRQEIGRGLRLCVDQAGDRVFGEDVNVLTIVANESYQAYASALQDEYFATGDAAPPAPSDARRRAAARNDRIFAENDDFRAFWSKLRRRLEYRVTTNTELLIEQCIERISAQTIPAPRLTIQKGDYVVRRYALTVEHVATESAQLRVEIADSGGETTSTIIGCEVGTDLARKLKDNRLRGFKITDIRPAEDAGRVSFDNGVDLHRSETQVFDSVEGQRVRESQTVMPSTTYPVGDVIARAARETMLTRATIGAIFRGLPRRIKNRVFRNPEGFAGIFATTIQNALADHIARSIEFIVHDVAVTLDLDELFPAEKLYAQRETMLAGETGLYDFIQVESGVESRFITKLIDDPMVVLYFKFPPTFKVPLPRVIGNYNPDWGIVRRNAQSLVTLHLVRETKGTTDVTALRFPHERRKIVSATKYFAASNIDYRVITDDTVDWWAPATSLGDQLTVDQNGGSSSLR